MTVPESAMLASPELMTSLWREVSDELLWRVEDKSGRYKTRIRRKKNRLIVHFTDTLGTTEGPMQRYRRCTSGCN